MKKMSISLVAGVAAILATILLYFLFLGNLLLEIICLITLLGVIIAEATVTAFAYFANGQPRKVAAAFVMALMVPISVVLSIVYIANFPNGYGQYAAWYVVCYLILLVIAFILWRFNDAKQQEEKAFQTAKNSMLNIRRQVKCLMADPAAAAYREDLRRVEEKLHFSNDNVIVEQDGQIYQQINALRDNFQNPEFDVPAALERLNQTIDTRNIMTGRTV